MNIYIYYVISIFSRFLNCIIEINIFIDSEYRFIQYFFEKFIDQNKLWYNFPFKTPSFINDMLLPVIKYRNGSTMTSFSFSLQTHNVPIYCQSYVGTYVLYILYVCTSCYFKQDNFVYVYQLFLYWHPFKLFTRQVTVYTSHSLLLL